MYPYANERRGKDHLISIRKDTRGIVFLFAQRNLPCTHKILFFILLLEFFDEELEDENIIFLCMTEAMGNRIEDVYGMIFKFYFYLFFRKIVPVFFNPFSFMGIFCDLFVVFLRVSCEKVIFWEGKEDDFEGQLVFLFLLWTGVNVVW